MSARPWLSGFCTPGNPVDSHDRCKGATVNQGEQLDCACECHWIPDPSPAPAADDSQEVRDVQAQSTGQLSAMRTDDRPEEAPRLGTYFDLDDVAYHADPTSVSASGMKTLLRSPAHFLHERTHPKKSKAMDLGTVTHHLVLGTGPEYAVLDPAVIGVKADGSPAASPTSTSAWKEAVGAAEREGKVVLTATEYAAAERMADAVLTHKVAGPLFTAPGVSEVSMFWRDPQFDLIRRCRWDRLGDDGVAADLKTTNNANPAALPKHCIDWGYDLSAAWYLRVAAGLGVDIAAYTLVFVESTEPHAVVVAELDDDFLARGEALAHKAITTYRRCLDTGQWPAFADDDAITLSPTHWSDTADQILLTIPEGNAA